MKLVTQIKYIFYFKLIKNFLKMTNKHQINFYNFIFDNFNPRKRIIFFYGILFSQNFNFIFTFIFRVEK